MILNFDLERKKIQENELQKFELQKITERVDILWTFLRKLQKSLNWSHKPNKDDQRPVEV